MSQTLSIACWNVNSLNTRLPRVLEWLQAEAPDVVCLQELKCMDEKVPRLELEDLGYNLITHGQKTYNGVAILSKHPLSDVVTGLPNFDDEQARYLEALVEAPVPFRVASLYAPNGNPVETEKFPYKLRWLDALHQRATDLMTWEEATVLCGDYNIIPTAADCHDVAVWAGDALYQPESRARYQGLLNLGLTDAYAARPDPDGRFTFWDYQGGAWQKNHGIRIDHHLLSPEAADRLQAVRIHKDTRAAERPSDHVPVVTTFAL